MFNLSRFTLETLKELHSSELTLKKYDLEDPILLEELIKEIKERKKELKKWQPRNYYQRIVIPRKKRNKSS